MTCMAIILCLQFTAAYMIEVESALLPDILTRELPAEEAQNWRSFVNAFHEGDLPTAHAAASRLAESEAFPPDTIAYFRVKKYSLERSMGDYALAQATLDGFIRDYRDDPRIALNANLEKGKFLISCAPKDSFQPTFPAIEQHYEFIFGHFSPYQSGMIEAHWDFGLCAMREARMNPLLHHYAEVAFNHIDEAKRILAEVQQNPSLSEDPRLVARLKYYEEALNASEADLREHHKVVLASLEDSSEHLGLADIEQAFSALNGLAPEFGVAAVRSDAIPYAPPLLMRPKDTEPSSAQTIAAAPIVASAETGPLSIPLVVAASLLCGAVAMFLGGRLMRRTGQAAVRGR